MSSHPKTTDNKADRIRELNDQLRKTFSGGAICITRGVSEHCDVKAILAAVQAFDNFNDANDPHHEHDFGAIEVGEHTEIGKPAEVEADRAIVMFKLDYYSRDMQQASPDAADPSITERVLTIFLDEES